ncbi:FAD/NAD(P)-binding protein [Streptomyces sp. FIT100]|uniref:FAD/NAD(P)-binding protein n=1 Tax=Streptomyces sp. FIT100 TaxID=2837956 RepID=UPI0021C64BE8|nr:FAD/NAD(P)-binding protein [Streptomyces sp. FIT100]UUN30770.1 FAD/NAD(P)-binding protein [Streptomyces sp. FIT100]
MGRMREIAVVGGGGGAVCLLEALSRTSGPPSAVTVFEPSDRLWRGRPYQRDSDCILVNLPSRAMSVRAEDREHFDRWLSSGHRRQTGETVQADAFNAAAFPPRALFGDYLESVADHSVGRLRGRGWRVRLVRERVVQAAPGAGGATLTTECGTQHHADRVVLCMGAGAPYDGFRLHGTGPGFIPDPYPVSKSLAGIDPHDSVAVLGTGLTAADVVLSLHAGGHQGPVFLLSRHGVLPAVRQQPIAHTMRHFTPDRFHDLSRAGQVGFTDVVQVLHDELASAGQHPAELETEFALLHEDPARRLRRQLDLVHSQSLALRILQHTLPVAVDVWPLMPHRDRSELLRNHYRAIHSLCCPMPPTTAARLLAMSEAGQLHIMGGLYDVGRARRGFTAATDSRQIHADTVVNAASVAPHRVPAAAAPLVESLITASAASAHPHGGLRVERQTSRLVANGGTQECFYALGDVTFGALFITAAMPVIVKLAQEISREVTGP